jgi:hypothetical protein
MVRMDDEQFESIVNSAAVPISAELDRLLAQLPPEIDPVRVVEALINEVGGMSSRPALVDLLSKGLLARRAFVELGIGV